MPAGAPAAPRRTSGCFNRTHPVGAHAHVSSCNGRALRQQKEKKLTARTRRRPRPVMKQNASSSDSFGSIDEEVLKELKNVPMVLATQDEMDVRDVVRGLRHRLKERMPDFRTWLRPAILVWPLFAVPLPLMNCNAAGSIAACLPHLNSRTSETEERGELVAVLVGAAVAFGFGIYLTLGADKAAEYFAGYLLEQSLSVDNLFVFVLIFDYFKVDQQGQDKVLAYGIASAALLRLIVIGLGTELVGNFQVVNLGFAAFLIFNAWQLVTAGEGPEEDLSDKWIVKACRKLIPVSDSYDGDNFFVVKEGMRMATPLLLALAVIEISDVAFAVDSIPAVFGVTHDPFIVWTSNMAAILSMRGLYAFVSTILAKLRFLDKSVAAALAWIGVKMFLDFFGVDVSTGFSLGVVVASLSIGVGASLYWPNPTDEDEASKL